jgi:hypothetical protein
MAIIVSSSPGLARRMFLFGKQVLGGLPVGICRIAALYCCSSTAYRIC